VALAIVRKTNEVRNEASLTVGKEGFELLVSTKANCGISQKCIKNETTMKNITKVVSHTMKLRM
jgi:hypothetical protein